MSTMSKDKLSVGPLKGFSPEIGRALWQMQDARRRTKAALEEIAEDDLDWVPPEGGNSIGTLLYHLAAIETDWLFTDVLQAEEFPVEIGALFPHDVRDVQGELSQVHGETLLEHYARLEVVRSQLLQAFQGMDLEDFRRSREFEDYTVTPEWVLHHLMQHEAEHRGQIGELRVRAEGERNS